MTAVTYTTVGPTSGSCDHLHTSVAEAVDCLHGDRQLVAVESGKRRPLTDVEFALMVGYLERSEPRTPTEFWERVDRTFDELDGRES